MMDCTVYTHLFSTLPRPHACVCARGECDGSSLYKDEGKGGRGEERAFCSSLQAFSTVNVVGAQSSADSISTPSHPGNGKALQSTTPLLIFCFPGEPETNSLSGERYHEQSSLHRRTQAYFSSHVSTAMTFSRHQQTCINTQLSVLLVRRPSMMPEFCGAGHSTRLVCVLAKYQLSTREHPDVNYILSVNPLVNGEGDDGYII